MFLFKELYNIGKKKPEVVIKPLIVPPCQGDQRPGRLKYASDEGKGNPPGWQTVEHQRQN